MTRAIWAIAIGLLATACTAPCSVDTDCKASRVCEQGACHEAMGGDFVASTTPSGEDSSCSIDVTTACQFCGLVQKVDSCGQPRFVSCPCPAPRPAKPGTTCETPIPIDTFPATVSGDLYDYARNIRLTGQCFFLRALPVALYTFELEPDETLIADPIPGLVAGVIKAPSENPNKVCNDGASCIAGATDSLLFTNTSGIRERYLLVLAAQYVSLGSHSQPFSVSLKKIARADGDTCSSAIRASPLQPPLRLSEANYSSTNPACSTIQGNDRVYVFTVPPGKILETFTDSANQGVSLSTTPGGCERMDCEGTRRNVNNVVWQNDGPMARDVYLTVSCSQSCTEPFRLTTRLTDPPPPPNDCSNPLTLTNGVTGPQQLGRVDSFPVTAQCGGMTGADTVWRATIPERTAFTTSLKHAPSGLQLTGVVGTCSLTAACEAASDDSLVLVNAGTGPTPAHVIVDGPGGAAYSLATTRWSLPATPADAGSTSQCASPLTAPAPGLSTSIDLGQGHSEPSDSCLGGHGPDAVVMVPVEGRQSVVVSATPLDDNDVSLALSDSALDCAAGTCQRRRNASGSSGTESLRLENTQTTSRGLLVRIGSQADGGRVSFLTTSSPLDGPDAGQQLEGGSCSAPGTLVFGEKHVVSLGAASEFSPERCGSPEAPDRVFEFTLQPREVLSVRARSLDPGTTVGVNFLEVPLVNSQTPACASAGCLWAGDGLPGLIMERSFQNVQPDPERVLVILESRGQSNPQVELLATLEADPVGSAVRPVRVTGSTTLVDQPFHRGGCPKGAVFFDVEVAANVAVKVTSQHRKLLEPAQPCVGTGQHTDVLMVPPSATAGTRRVVVLPTTDTGPLDISFEYQP